MEDKPGGDDGDEWKTNDSAKAQCDDRNRRYWNWRPIEEATDGQNETRREEIERGVADGKKIPEELRGRKII